MEATRIELPIYYPRDGHAVLGLTPTGPKVLDVYLTESAALRDAKGATRWSGTRHIVAPARNGLVEVLI